jgi:hypothetical protein
MADTSRDPDSMEAYGPDDPTLSAAEHEALMNKLRASTNRPIDVTVLGQRLAGWCIEQGWVVQCGTEYEVTPAGAKELLKRFRIDV